VRLRIHRNCVGAPDAAANRVRALVIAALLASSAPARADEPETATWISLGTTAGGVVALTGGIVLVARDHRSAGGSLVGLGLPTVIVGPSLGHFYAGDFGTDALGVRLVAMLGIVTVWFVGGMGECPHESCDFPREVPVTATLMAAGLATLAASAVWDIATAGKVRARPHVVPAPHGLALVGTF
jgi:hypothetical protein